ncbi:hypothetical protein ACP8HI_21610 [Paenibacillus sp. FA6]
MQIDEIVKKHNQEENGQIQFSGATLFGLRSEIKFGKSYGVDRIS